MKIIVCKRNKGVYIKALEHTAVVKAGYLSIVDSHGIETFYQGFEEIKALGTALALIFLGWGLTVCLSVL